MTYNLNKYITLRFKMGCYMKKNCSISMVCESVNWIDSHNRVDEDVTIGNCKINRFHIADDLVLLAFSKPGVSNSNCSVGHMRTYKVTAGRIMTLTQQ